MRDCTVAETKALISCAVATQLICAFVFAFLKNRFYHAAAQLLSDEDDSQNKFSSLLEAANIAKEQVQKTLGKRPSTGDTSSVAKRTRLSGPTESPTKAGGDTPRSLRSGRAVSSKFLEGVASLKKKTKGIYGKDQLSHY